MNIIPEFNSYSVFIEPWVDNFNTSAIIVLMGFLVTASCGLIGNYIILRKMALLGDAISHSLLPGIVIAFLITGTRNTIPLFLGAIAVGVLTVLLIEFIHKNSKIKPDAAMGIVFSLFFAVGIILVTSFADHVDLDMECVLYGELAFVPFETFWSIGGIEILPYSVVRMLSLFMFLLVGIFLFYKELLLCTFDPLFAFFLGIKPHYFQYGLTIVLSLVLVSAFKSVGAILGIAMLLFPGCTAMLVSNKMNKITTITLALASLYPILGFHLAAWLNSSISAAITVSALGLFILFYAYSAVLRVAAKR